MDKKELFLKGVFCLILFVVAFLAVFLKSNTMVTDAARFKEEYESLNNTVKEGSGITYNHVSIPEDNPMKYVTAMEAVDIVQKKTGMLYIGANWCPWCRNAVEVLIEIAKEKNVNTIYYLDLTDYRNVWEVKDGSLEKTKVEQEGYYELLRALDSILGDENYTLKDQDGKAYDTKEKRIYLPTVVAIKNGKIEKSHVGTVKFNIDQTPYDKLTESQKEELKNTYNGMFESIASNVCSSGDYCD